MIYYEDNFPELPSTWISISVGDAIESAGNSNKKLTSKEALEYGRFPVIDQGQNEISGYSDDESLVVDASKSNPVILFGDHTRVLKKISQSFVPGADGTKLFHAKKFLDSGFVYQMLRAIKLPDKGYARHYQHLRNSVLPLPPLAEQKRIADKLDTVLARVDACRDRLNRVPLIIKRFRQSVLAAATSGKLTEDWRTQGDSNSRSASHRQSNLQTNGWRKVTLATIGDFGRGKSKHRPRNDPKLFGGEYPFIQTGDISNSGGLVTRHSQTYSEFGLKQSKLWPAETLCITIAANIADTAILTYPACFPDSIVGFAANKTECLVRYVKWAIDVIKNDLETYAPATAQKNINLSILSDIEFYLPPLEEQHEIVRRVEILFAFADRLEVRLATARITTERLTPALLAKAFRGELVPQDPNDEHAADLLKRLALIRPEMNTRSKRIKTGSAGKESRVIKEHAMLQLKDISVSHLTDVLKKNGPMSAERLWSLSQLDIDDFYDQLKAEEKRGLLREIELTAGVVRQLEAI